MSLFLCAHLLSVLPIITGHSTSVFIFNSTFFLFLPHITSLSPAEPRFETTFKRDRESSYVPALSLSSALPQRL